MPELKPEEIFKYLQLRWKLDVIDIYLGITCGVYGCRVTAKICPRCRNLLDQKLEITNQIFTLAEDKTYLEAMGTDFKSLMNKLSIVNRDQPDILIDRGVKQEVVDKRKSDFVEKFKYMDLNYLFINKALSTFYDTEDSGSVE